MAFDPTQPYEPVGGGFDASKPFQTVGSAVLDAPEGPQTPTPPSPAQKHFDTLYSGLNGLDEKLPTGQKMALKQVDQVSDNPEESRARVINQSYLQAQGVSQASIQGNYQAVKDAFMKQKLGVDQKGVTDTALYTAIVKRKEEDSQPITGEIRAWTWKDTLESGYAENQKKLSQFWDSISKPFVELDEAPADLPNHPMLGPFNPALNGAVYNGFVKPMLEGIESPVGVATASAAEAYPLGKLALSGIEGVFTGMMLYGAAKGGPQLMKTLKDPDVSLQDKGTAFAGELSQLGLGLLGSTHLAIEAYPKAKGLFKGPVAEVAEKVRAEIPNATMEEGEHLKNLADDLDKIAQPVKKPSEIAQGWDELKQVFAPAARGEDATEAAGALREHGAELAQRTDRATAALEDASKTLMKMDPEARWDAVDKIENGEGQDNPKLQRFADASRQILDSTRDEIRALGTGKLEHFIDDYFPHLWKDPEAAADAFQQAIGKAPMEGSKNFLKQRTIPTIKEGISLGLEPATNNPVEMLLLKKREMDKYLLGQKWIGEMKEKNLVRFVRATDRPPEGYIKINDPIATVYGKASHPGASQIEGHYYAPSSVGTVANNYLSPGLRKHAAFRAYLSAANSLNQFQLGLSAFHLGFTSVDASISKLALAIEYGAQGKPLKAAGSLAKVPVAPISNMLQGNRVLREWMKPGSEGEEFGKIVDSIRAGGGRAKMDAFYQTTITKKMKEMFGEGTAKGYFGALWRAPLAALEQTSKPIMEYVVPRQKLGVAADMIKKELERMPANATHEDLRKVMGKVWDSVDNRMGQMVYDNLFWNKTAKDLATASVRSVGWNLGTLRELGGGVLDTAAFARDLLKDKPKAFSDVAEFKGKQSGMGFMPDFDMYNLKEDIPGHPKDSTVSDKTLQEAGYEVDPKQKAEFTHRMAYAIALPTLTGILGATYQYLKTGKGPEELRDYFFPKTGEVDAQGRDVRLSMPTYMKDVYHYAHDPVGTVEGKVHPAISLGMEMLNNKDFFGREIRHADDPIVKQMSDEAKHFAENFLPMGIKNLGTSIASGQSNAEKAANFVGVTRAPAWVSESTAEQLAGKLAGDKFKSSDSPDAKKVADRKKVMEALRNGDSQEKQLARSKLNQLVENGEITSQQKRNILRGKDHSYLENAVSHLDAREAMRVFNAADMEERQSIKDAVHKKIVNAHLPHEDRKELLEKFKQLSPERDIHSTNRKTTNPE